MKTDELRESYLAFFETKGCVRKPSDVLVPTWDPSVLFTPAGMNQFKDHFLGRVKLEFTRATTCQKCLRTGDIDNVGRTPYHHTFFEMLGNFSFGDYFKREAIAWAWEYLTSPKWLKLPADRLSVTVYLDDDEAYNIWHDEIKVPAERIRRCGEEDNFWPASAPSQGPDGVCGPCSEIYYAPPGGKEVEIWNLVFTQFNRVGNPPNNLRPLPKKNIDTGMGLERTAATLQGVETNYHIDILRPIVEAAAEVCKIKYDPASDSGRRLRRITDHVRACTFAVHENVYPGPNKQKYVIRRLLRRAVLDGHQIGMREPFLHQLVPVVAEMMKRPYPDLSETVGRCSQVIRQEESAFLGTIDAGLNKIEGVFESMRKSGRTLVRGEDIHFMYDTHGFPPELFEQIAAEHNFTFDWEGYRELLKGREAGASGPLFKETKPVDALKRAGNRTQFLGYDTMEAEAKVVGVIAQGHLCDSLEEEGHDQPVTVVLDRSPFYGESGGQVGDTGELVGQGVRFEVTDTQRDGDVVLHIGHLRQGKLSEGTKVTARVETKRRQAIKRAHSATHLLHYALRNTLGQHAQQQGSKVDDDWLRFDFTNLEPVGAERLATIESEVSAKVRAKDPVTWTTLPIADARKQGAMMLFGEKYPDPVRMVSMGDYSRELCGGTHLTSTAEVEDFEILSEESVSAGVRRVVALTGAKARQHAEQTKAALDEAAKLLGVPPAEVADGVAALAQQVRELRKQASSGQSSPLQSSPLAPREEKASRSETARKTLDRQEVRHALERAARALNVSALDVPKRVAALVKEAADLKTQLAAGPRGGELSADKLIESAALIAGVKVIVAEATGANPNVMRQLIDQVRRKASPAAVLLASCEPEKVTVVAGVSQDLIPRGADAGRWVKETAAVVGGGGGGKPDMAQAGGKLPEKLPDALAKAREVIAAMVKG
jgi:alanyl-tRNA synthetase